MDDLGFRALTWLGIAVCISQSAIFSGLNLAVFGVSRMRLEVETTTGGRDAARVLRLRQDSNFVLTTILWGNVAINVLLTLLSDSVLAGVSAFLFSTIAITFLGEITPQAYCSRHALRVAAAFSPVLRFYQVLLYPVAKPTAKMLDWWLGSEGIHYYREQDFREVILRHMGSDSNAIDRVEGLGALNFLALDDIPVSGEGALVDPLSIIELPVEDGIPRFPRFDGHPSDPFLARVQASGKRWAVVTDPSGVPVVVLDADGFLRAAVFGETPPDPRSYCHRPIVVEDDKALLGEFLSELELSAEAPGDEVIDHDVILGWGEQRRIITGSDLLGRLLRGIVPPHVAP